MVEAVKQNEFANGDWVSPCVRFHELRSMESAILKSSSRAADGRLVRVYRRPVGDDGWCLVVSSAEGSKR